MYDRPQDSNLCTSALGAGAYPTGYRGDLKPDSPGLELISHQSFYMHVREVLLQIVFVSVLCNAINEDDIMHNALSATPVLCLGESGSERDPCEASHLMGFLTGSSLYSRFIDCD